MPLPQMMHKKKNQSRRHARPPSGSSQLRGVMTLTPRYGMRVRPALRIWRTRTSTRSVQGS